ncbi:type II secretion system protein GspM [Fulvimonas sp. R45]|jgi:general secretion pathway protein M|uniref:type II secretion system protein GspM n=1 Tax=Fulvimonas sp. R45 TaxID=3045937 RepID=UPI002660033D|nr:type II secretion system protein GspM [Fulvimonas sp. R45]MDO1528949.1 type II secretion system protein GspM [Fulvimonas sp. R45]
MKLKPLRPAERRVAAVLLLLLALALAYLVLLHWWFVAPLRDIDAGMDELRDTQSRYAAAIASEPQLRRRLAELGQGQADSRAFLPERDPGAAAAGLMQRVVDDAAAHAQDGSCEVTQKMPVPNPPDHDDGPYRRVAVSISLRCGMRPLTDLLYTLEHGTPYLFVSDFSLYRNPVAAQRQAAALEVQFTLSGYVRGAPATPSPPERGPGDDADAGDAP